MIGNASTQRAETAFTGLEISQTDGQPSKAAITPDQLSALLAQRVLHWQATPERFLTGNRSWLPRWKFQPTRKRMDALRLLGALAPQEYSIGVGALGAYSVKVRVGGRTAHGQAKSEPLAICLAVADALGIEVVLVPPTGVRP
jgi:hypothetical protein